MSVFGQRIDSAELEKHGYSAQINQPFRRSQLRECLLRRERKSDAVEKNSASSRVAAASAPVSKSKLSILLAEDNNTNRLVAVRMLEKLGHQIHVAVNGKEAVEVLQKNPCDVILMDCQMPEMDGFEATRRIRKGEAGAENIQIPIIAFTANASQSDPQRCRDAGMDGFVTKPVQYDELASVLARWSHPKQSGEKMAPPLKSAEHPAAAPAHSKCPTADVKTSRAVPAAISTFDLKDFMERMMNDAELAKQVAKGFVADLPQQITTLRSAVQNGGFTRAAELAHRLKGASGTVSGRTLRRLAMEMEQAAKDENRETEREILPQLETESAALAAALTDFLNEDIPAAE